MKIDLQNKLGYYTAPVTEPRAKQAKPSAAAKTASCFDGLTIHSTQTLGEDEQFAASLTSRLSMEVRKPVTPAQINDLQQQIDEGKYQVDVGAIVEKMLLY